MYYDDFELACGCRMWCKCDKVVRCENCGGKAIKTWSYPGWHVSCVNVNCGENNDSIQHSNSSKS